MSKIGLFGGTFDPIHTGHIELAKLVRERFNLDRIIFIPAGNPPHKANKKTAGKAHRFNMVKLATEGFPDFEISDFDIIRDEPNYSYVTISHFKEKFPEDEIFFIVGGDSFLDLPKWKKPELLMSLCTFIVVSRPGIKKDDYLKNYDGVKPDALFLDDANYDFSSTEVREKLINKLHIGGLVPSCVEEYIKTNKLYL